LGENKSTAENISASALEKYMKKIKSQTSYSLYPADSLLSIGSAGYLVEHLYTAHQQAIFRYFFFRLRNRSDAEDLSQSVFMKAFSSLKNGIWNGEGGIHYLFVIARNTLIDYFRKNRHTPIVSDDLTCDLFDTVTTDGPVEAREREELIAMAIAKLPCAEAQAVTLRFIKDMDYEAISVIMGKRKDTIRQLVHRGRKALRKHIACSGLFD
jgi:RNA polymerase sigma-70 factor (ECF subfamily)